MSMKTFIFKFGVISKFQSFLYFQNITFVVKSNFCLIVANFNVSADRLGFVSQKLSTFLHFRLPLEHGIREPIIWQKFQLALVNLCLAAIHRILSSKTNLADNSGTLFAELLESGLCIVMCKHRESSLSPATSMSCKNPTSLATPQPNRLVSGSTSINWMTSMTRKRRIFWASFHTTVQAIKSELSERGGLSVTWIRWCATEILQSPRTSHKSTHLTNFHWNYVLKTLCQ